MASTKEDMFPVRVIIETVQPQHCLSCAHDGIEILDTFVIISGHTMVGQLVGNILSALGFPQYISISRGLVQICNWKPLPLETITDNQEELVSKLFKEVSTSISFRILIKQSTTVDTQNSSCITDLKQRLLKVAIEKQPSILTSVDNQELKQVIQQLISGNEESSSAVTSEHVTAINEWLNQLSHENSSGRTSSLHSIRFHQVFELPRMEKWFNSDANPSRQKLINYVNVLNTLPSRRTSNKVTYQQLCNWFANKRAIARMRANGEAANAPLMQKSTENSGADLTASLSSLLNTITSSSNQEALTTTTVTDNNNDGSSNNNNNNSCDTNAGGVGADVTITTTGHIIPLATTPIDIRSKFINTSSSNNDYVLSTLDGERMDGGSESPNGNDDASVNSVNSPSDTNYEADMKESGASSPTGMLLDSNHAISPQPPSSNGGMLNNSNGGSLGGFSLSPSTLLASQMSTAQNHHLVTAATQNNNNSSSQSSLMAAFSSLMPSLMNSHMGSAFLNVAAAANNNNNNHQSVPVCSSPMSSSSSMNNFGGNSLLKSASSSCKEETGGKTDSSSINNNNQNGGGAARSRLMFDPLSELPILESWFEENPHPGCFQIEQFTERLNSFPYRQNYPPISTHNVKIWFKNRRAKCKRLNLSDMSSKMALSAN